MNGTAHLYSYLAGLIDGEGSLLIQRKRAGAGKLCKRGYQRRYLLTISNTSKELLTTVKDSLGYGNLVEHGNHKQRWKTCYTLRFYEGTLRTLLPEIIPHLILKKRQAEIVSECLSLITSTSTIDSAKHEQRILELEEEFRKVSIPRGRPIEVEVKNNSKISQ